MTDRVRLIDSDAGWQSVLPGVAGTARLAVDLEGDGFHRYPERVALIQLGLPDGAILLLDPLAIKDLNGLGALLAGPALTKIMHSADFDIRSLDRDFGFRLHDLYDTAIAALFCGSERTGLANVLAEHLGVVLDKPTRLQRLDWSRRPLPAEAVEYAAGDVLHLLSLADVLAGRLAALGRTDWVDEECRRLEGVRYALPEPPAQAFLALRGARQLSGRERALLRELYVFRDHEARRLGRPPYRVLSDQALLALTHDPQRADSWGRGQAQRSPVWDRRALVEAVQRGQAAEPVPWPNDGRVNPWTPAARERLMRLKRWRLGEAERLALGAGTVWPAAHLEQMALHPDRRPADVDRGDPPWVRQWQWRELGPSLERFRAGSFGAGA
jgi:ribonuclease D